MKVVLHHTIFLLSAVMALGLGAAQAKPREISGVVSYTGKVTPSTPDRSADAFCAKNNVPQPAIAVSNGKLGDVFVRLKIGSIASPTLEKKPVVIDQVGCNYQPRVVGAMVGQPLQIKNGDGTMHNVHAYLAEETLFNRGQPKASKPIEQAETGKPGDVLLLKCDVHSWMKAFIPITDHPFFAVSNGKGEFSIANVPPGTYTLEAWHPELGTKTSSVTVSAKGETSKVEFSFP